MNTEEFESKRIATLISELSKKYDKCILCGRLTKNRGVFFPNKTGEFGASDKKYRVVIYSLCWRHEQNEETLNEVEKYLHENKTGIVNLTNEVFGGVQ